MQAVRKNISITKVQDQFLKANNISLSKMVQKMIDQAMDDINFAKVTEKNLAEMEKGKGTRMDFDEFIEEMKKW